MTSTVLGSRFSVLGSRLSALGVVGFAIALAAAAQVAIPLPGTPVPMTLQPLVVVLAGMMLGPTLGAASMVLYLAAGAMGAPVFAPGGLPGVARLLGPTGGYLVGYVAAAFIMGVLAERGWDRSLLRVTLMMAVGHLVIFAFGLLWLTHLVGPAKAWAVGAAPFMAGTILKTALAAALMKGAWSLVRL